MEDKDALKLLQELPSKYPLSEEEREAVSTAIGILSWSSLAEGRIKQMKKARDKRSSAD